MIGRFLGRFPKLVSSIILAAFAVSIWQATVYVETVIEPREAAAREARIEREIRRAERLFERAEYDIAISEFDYVLTAFADELDGRVKGRLHDKMGRSLIGLAVAGDEKGSFESGLKALREALTFRSAKAEPAGHIETRYHIGDAYLAMSRIDGKASSAGAAIEAFEGGLALLSPETDRALYANGLRSIGNAHRRLHEIDAEAHPLDDAFRHYDAAMRIARPLEEPIAHGNTLMEVARAYVLLAEQGYRHRELKNAIKTYEKALTVFTVDAFPRLHAGTHNEMGDTYTVMSKLKARSRTERARHEQLVIRYQNKAKQSYRIARSFGFEAGFEIADAVGSSAQAVEEEKKQ